MGVKRLFDFHEINRDIRVNVMLLNHDEKIRSFNTRLFGNGSDDNLYENS